MDYEYLRNTIAQALLSDIIAAEERELFAVRLVVYGTKTYRVQCPTCRSTICIKKGLSRGWCPGCRAVCLERKVEAP